MAYLRNNLFSWNSLLATRKLCSSVIIIIILSLSLSLRGSVLAPTLNLSLPTLIGNSQFGHLTRLGASTDLPNSSESIFCRVICELLCTCLLSLSKPFFTTTNTLLSQISFALYTCRLNWLLLLAPTKHLKSETRLLEVLAITNRVGSFYDERDSSISLYLLLLLPTTSSMALDHIKIKLTYSWTTCVWVLMS